MSPNSTISVSYVVRLLELAERRGAAAAPLLSSAGIEPPTAMQPDVRVPTENYYRLWSAAMAALRDPSFPMQVASYMDPASFDAFGFAVVTSANYGEAVGRIQRFLPFVADGARWVVEYENDSVVLIFIQEGAPNPAHRYVDEFSLAHMVVVGRELTNIPWELEAVRFRHAKPEDVTAHDAFFRAPIAFDCEATQLRMARSVLELPFAKADPSMAAFFDRHIQSALQRTHPEQKFLASVRALLAESLVRNAFTLEDLAQHLTLSPRTLRRRLREAGTSYSDLLDAVRQGLAEQYLRERRFSLGEIAFALGYSEPAAFHRAFRRWKNITPAAYRALHHPDAPAPEEP